MNKGKIIFSQILDFLPLHEFRKCVERYQGNYKVQSFSCLDQFLCMAFAQLTYRESLRDTETCLRAMKSKLYHMGIRGKVSRSTLADANEKRDWRIYADFAQVLISTARSLYHNDDFGVELKNTVYALDGTVIDLCLSLSPWAKPINQQPNRGALKLHTLLDLRGNIPVYIKVTGGNVYEATVLDELIPEPGSFYIMDRGYMDLKRLRTLAESLSFFVVRATICVRFKRLYSHAIDKSAGLKCDQTVVFVGGKSKVNYPHKLRRVHYFDAETNKNLSFFTNNFSIPALTVAQLYKQRWQIELFFKWIKQHLRIKSFYGTSSNAVKTQIWIAISVYVLVAIIKKRLKLGLNLYTILQILSIACFEKDQLLQVVTNFDHKEKEIDSNNQLLLFNL